MNQLISEQFYNESQSWHYQRVLNVDGRKYKIYIRRNAYDCQSYLHGYCFDTNTTSWQRLVELPIYNAACESVSYVQKSVDKSLFEKDADSVLTQLQQIVEE